MNEAVNSAADLLAERELRIEFWPDYCVWYEGTAAQLVAEGLIPEGFEWPAKPGSFKRSWDANGFGYSLFRKRPDDHKGPKGSWFGMDNWCIRVSVNGRDSAWHHHRSLQRRAEELRAEYYELSAAGSREANARWKRYWAARDDKAFQAFKSRIPGLVPPKRGRKPKQASQVGGAS